MTRLSLPEHPAHWIVGYLASPDALATHLLDPAPPPREPEILFEPPSGWKTKASPFRLDLRYRKLIGSIMVTEKEALHSMRHQFNHIPLMPHVSASREHQHVRFGDTSGEKHTCRQTMPVIWKRIDYLLEVPGGCVILLLDSRDVEFDETPLESRLHTLRLLWE